MSVRSTINPAPAAPASLALRIQRRLFGLSPDEVSFERRGFHASSSAIRARLETVGGSFVAGYHAALETGDPDSLALRLEELDAELKGFAYEGAGMALALLDLLTPWKRNRLRAFLDGPGAPHTYMVHVGAGWAVAQLRGNLERALQGFDPFAGWLAADGYGFHHAYFRPKETVGAHQVPASLSGYARRVFDQGVGRALWFVEGADVDRLPCTISGFAPERYEDLWSGLGLACAYAGGVEAKVITRLRDAAGPHLPAFAQGASFAALTRQRAGNPTSHTALATQLLCGVPAEEAAAIARAAIEQTRDTHEHPAHYERVRRHVQARLAGTADRAAGRPV